ncbi:energy-coupling factor transporter ATPase [Caldalkalibacillus salinus]|uniref:energy-coupling factor transporter ATPase n=1 Tax=Caldalkalibacillus salinus TaxID=2803787 RepID=UPI0019233852|nr:energy-coupling factor transporter ATPase [Caldalkalibacillus salinus]
MDIQLDNVSFVYHPRTPFEQKVLDHISLEINTGEWLAIIGHTGSGKSTLVQHLNGLLTPTEGTVHVGDTDIESHISTDTSELYQDVGMVFQYPEHQLFGETVAEDIAFGLKNLGWKEDMIPSRIEETLQVLGMPTTLLDRSPFELSGGQKRRVALAGVIAMDPDVLILDEPTAGLDPVSKRQLMLWFQEWQKAHNKTIITITHDMQEVADYANTVAVMEDGKCRLKTDPQDLFTAHHTDLERMSLQLPRSYRFVQQLQERMDIDIHSVKKEALYQAIVHAVKREKREKGGGQG